MLPSIIHPNQTGFVAGRSIGNNIRKAIDIVKYAEIRKVEALIMSVDFQKAFDRAEYHSLDQILGKFGVGPKFRELTQILFKEFNLSITNAGHQSDYFVPSRGLFQGNPISSFLFVTIVEILALMLRANPDIEAIEIKGIKYLLSQFADDLDLFLKSNVRSLNVAIDTIMEFCRYTGMRMNMEKTTVYRIGSVRFSNARLYTRHQLHWATSPINILGVLVTHQLEKLSALNYDNLINEMENQLQAWKKRGLSLIDKIQVINTLMYSKFVYRMTNMPLIESSQMNRFNSILLEFIWEGKKARMPNSILTLHKLEGGAGPSQYQA